MSHKEVVTGSPSRFPKLSRQKDVFNCSNQSSTTATTVQQTQQVAAPSGLRVSIQVLVHTLLVLQLSAGRHIQKNKSLFLISCRLFHTQSAIIKLLRMQKFNLPWCEHGRQEIVWGKIMLLQTVSVGGLKQDSKWKIILLHICLMCKLA